MREEQADLWQKAGKNGDAERCFGAAAEYWYQHGKTLAKEGDKKSEALEAFNRALTIGDYVHWRWTGAQRSWVEEAIRNLSVHL